MKKLLYLAAAMLTTLVVSCGGGSSNWQEERDSIMSVNEQQSEILDDLTETLVDVSASLDSITMQENMLKSEIKESGTTKQQMLNTLSSFKKLLAENKAKMAEMESKLAGRDDQLAKMSKLIKFLNEELAKKEETINQLLEQLSQKNATIASLNTNIDNLNTTIAAKDNVIEDQKKDLSAKTESMSTVYYIMGEKSELKAKGVLEGKWYQKKKVDYNKLDMSVFTKANMNSLRSIKIPSGSPKIMTGVNQSACTINKINKKTSELVINDPAAFWSTTKVLIIKY